MAAKTIETRAVISAQDKTGQTFAQVAQKLRGLEQNAAAASRRMDSVARGMSAVGARAREHADIARKMAYVAPVAGGGRGTFFAAPHLDYEKIARTAAAAGAAAAVAMPAVRKIIEQASARQHETIAQSLSGMTDQEVKSAKAAAQTLGRKYKAFTETDIGATIREARTIAGSYQGAVDAAEPLLKYGTAMKYHMPGISSEELGQQLNYTMRAADIAGLTRNTETLNRAVDAMARTMAVFGKTVNPEEYFTAIQKAGIATTRYSPAFMAGALPSVIQTFGGAAAGTSLRTMFQSIIGGHVETKSAKLMGEFGLLDPKKIVRTKTGDIRGIMPGGIKGADLMLSNPFEYANKILAPALAKKGIKDENRMIETIAGMFSNPNAGKIMAHFIVNREQVQRDIDMAAKGKGLDEQFKEITSKDFGVATENVKSQFNNLAATMGSSVTPQLTTFGNRLAEILSNLQIKAGADVNTNAALLTAGAAGATVIGGTGLGAGLGLFSGAGVGAGAAGGLAATTPLFAALPYAYAGYKGFNAYKSVKDVDQLPPQNWLEEKAAAFDRWAGIGAKQKSWSEVAAGLRGMGANGQIKAEAELKGAADVNVKVTVETDKDSVVREVTQNIRASGNMRSDVGTTMPMGQ